MSSSNNSSELSATFAMNQNPYAAPNTDGEKDASRLHERIGRFLVASVVSVIGASLLSLAILALGGVNVVPAMHIGLAVLVIPASIFFSALSCMFMRIPTWSAIAICILATFVTTVGIGYYIGTH